ncbi:MAG: elongator complex protein 3 [Bacteroidales bacterium]
MPGTEKHFNIAIFIPEEGCRFQCVFCNQRNISGRQSIPSRQEVIEIIDKHLETQPVDSVKEIAFFGGNFTGLPRDRQEELLAIATEYFQKGLIHAIRFSTRPDFIDEDTLTFLKKFPVKTIELGVQSFSDHVLRKSGRGHTASQNREAALKVKAAGFELVLQMMTGLPGASVEDDLNTAQTIISLGAKGTRIYPCLVIQGTALEKMYHERKYRPQELEEAVRLSAQLIQLFEQANVKVLRVGLHPSEQLLNGTSLVAGPFHPAFRQMAETLIWNDRLKQIPIKGNKTKHLTVRVAPKALIEAIGFKKQNKNWLIPYFHSVRFEPDPTLKNREFTYCID